MFVYVFDSEYNKIGAILDVDLIHLLRIGCDSFSILKISLLTGRFREFNCLGT